MVTPQEFAELVQTFVTHLQDSPRGIDLLATKRGDRVCHVVQQVDIEVYPDITQDISPRFDLDLNQCASTCCEGLSLEEGSGFLSFREACEQNVRRSLLDRDPVARDTDEGKCSMTCLPARFANRPGLPNIPTDCPAPGEWKRGLFPSCAAADLRQILDCARDSACDFDDVLASVADTCRACAASAHDQHNGDLLQVLNECDAGA